MEDGVPSEAEVEWAVKSLQNIRAGGTPSSTVKGAILTGMVSPGGGTRLYSVVRSAGALVLIYYLEIFLFLF